MRQCHALFAVEKCLSSGSASALQNSRLPALLCSVISAYRSCQILCTNLQNLLVVCQRCHALWNDGLRAAKRLLGALHQYIYVGVPSVLYLLLQLLGGACMSDLAPNNPKRST